MGFHKISRDVKLVAIRLHERNLLSLPDILDSCGFSERTWFRILRLWRETGDVVNHQPSAVMRGRLRALNCEDIDCLLLHFTTIFRELERADMSYKKLKRIANRERNETLRAAFIARMAQYDPSELGFIDKTSKDEQTPGRHYGRSRMGTQALLTLDGIVAATVVEGSMTQELFLEWLEKIVVSLVMNMYCRISMY
ncbi:hypothetical protein DEU56DRAFT_868348 [Suillus clintonianus]|uniref:uncharacterized protein n=1 Tax=Suillus clintonianus TaxID=1904413 RepID=UPI001B86E04E|nr:uncharacterized protein DEU56DRAFT_868348 [Suillus clintonianus]KAG2154807.1 hypothetical protein DEU56DRAFT_868348 [Suillus clintonianus]